VHDSAHHIEHRALGLDRNNRHLVLQPIEEEFISAPFGMLNLESLRDEMLGYTASDGHLREVGISTLR
jgi:hypothetical protein